MANSDEKTETKTLRSNEPVYNHNAYSFEFNEEMARKYQREEDEETQRVKIIRAVVLVLVILLIVLSSSRLVFWLLQPEQPSIQIDSFSISKFNVSDSNLWLDWHAKFTVTNLDNRYSLTLSETFCYFTYEGRLLSGKVGEEIDKKLKPKQKSELNFKSKGEVKQMEVKDQTTVEEVKDRAGKGLLVDLEINLLASVIALADSWWDRKAGFHMSCGRVPVKFESKLNSATALIGGSIGRPCSFTSYGVIDS